MATIDGVLVMNKRIIVASEDLKHPRVDTEKLNRPYATQQKIKTAIRGKTRRSQSYAKAQSMHGRLADQIDRKSA